MRVLFILFTMLLLASTCLAAEPEGYNGIVWGQPSSEVQDIVLLGYDMNASFYEPVESLKVVKLNTKLFCPQQVQYTFINERFAKTLIKYDSISKNAIIGELIDQYGEPQKKEFPRLVKWFWKGQKAIVVVTIPNNSSCLMLEYMDKEILVQQLAQDGRNIADYP